MAVFQQTFLGASITNFSTNLGFGSNSSTMNINLVGDNENVRGLSNGKSRLVNGVREGYSYDSDASINLFPIDLWKDLNNRFAGGINDITTFKNTLYNQGDFFWAPPAGSPVFFSYFDNKRWYDFQNPANGNNVNSPDRQYLRDRWGAASLSFGGIVKSMEKQWDAGTGVTYSVTLEDPRSILEGTQVVLSDSIALTAPPDQDLQIFFDIGGVERKLNRGFNGAYNVLNPFGYNELRHDPSQTIFPNKYPFSYNELGIAGTNESGFPWMTAASNTNSGLMQALTMTSDFYDYKHLIGVQYALESMLGGWNATYFQRGEPFGGGLFYGQANSLRYKNTPGLPAGGGLPAAPFSADAAGTIGTHAYRFAVDLTDLRKLNEAMNPTYLTNTLDFNGNRKMYWGGTIPNSYRLQGQSMSLLHLIQEVCKTAGADFFVTLLPGCFINHSNDNTPIGPWYNGSRLLDGNHNYYSGVIKINVIQRNREVNVGVISQTVHDATENHKGPWAADSIDCLALKKADCLGVKGFRSRCEWNDQITKCQSKGGVTQANIGREFTDAVSNIVMYGGARSRIVGVTPIGAARKRKEIFVDQDNSYQNHCWNLGPEDCANHRVNGVSDCRWNDNTDGGLRSGSIIGTCTGFGETDPYFIEYLPNIELDGATLQGLPADESVDSSYGINNDNYINWHWHRHQPIWDGGINTQATDNFPHDINALNSVSAIGSMYSCSYSFNGSPAGRNRVSSSLSYEILTRDAGHTNVDSCVYYQHYGRCSDELAGITQADCVANNIPAVDPILWNQWIVEEWKDPKGLCGKNKCTWNSCTTGGTEWAVLDEAGCIEVADGAVYTYTPDYTEDTYDRETCVGHDGYNTVYSYDSAPYFYIEDTHPNVSERYCNFLDNDYTSTTHWTFIPNHWNHGDGFIDLFPMWGFDSADDKSIVERGVCDNARYTIEEDCVAGGHIWHNPQGLITSYEQGAPILGIFNDDDPYRDSDESDGIGSPFSYFNRWQGSCYSFGPHPSHVEVPWVRPAGTRGARAALPREVAGHVYETIDGIDVAQCLDASLHHEAHWISYCNNYMANGGGAGDAFSPGMTVHTKVHQHSCNQCMVGGVATAAPTELACTVLLGTWTTAFLRVKDNKLRMKLECDALPHSHWEIQFQDPLTRFKPVFETFRSIVPTDSNYTSCELRDHPSVIENITIMARNIGYCDIDVDDAQASPGSYSPEDCQTMLGIGFLFHGASTGAGNPAVWNGDAFVGDVPNPTNPTGSWGFVNDWMSKDGNFDNSFLYPRPATATIPIHLPTYIIPDSSTNLGGSSGNVYYATVTELRHAADSFESWISFLYNFDPFLLCEMEWQDCPESPNSSHTHNTAMRNVMGQILIPDYVTIPRGPGAFGRAFSQGQKEEFNQLEVYNLVRSIVDNNYGLTYLMPLPMTPRLNEKCFSFGGTANKEECLEHRGEWGYAGFQNEWTRDEYDDIEEDRWDIASSAWVGDHQEGGRVQGGFYYGSEFGHVRYPEHANFWTTDGNCESFVTYPRLETQRLTKLSVDVNFLNIDPESMWSLPAYTNGNLGGKTQGKAFVKASVDAKTYWLQTPDSKWNCYETVAKPSNFDSMDETACIAAGGVWQNNQCELNYANGTILGKHASEKSCRDNGGFWQENFPLSEETFFRPYALIRVVSPAFYEKDDTIKVRDDFVGCKDPHRFKTGMAAGQRKMGQALGVCVDKRPTPAAPLGGPLGLDDATIYTNPHREHMDEGYGCHYEAPCRDEVVVSVLGPFLFGSKIVLRRALEGDRKPIQDEATCLDQPTKWMSCGGVMQLGLPTWAPEDVCEVMTNSTGQPTSDGKWLPAGLAECEDIPIRKEENGFIVTKFTKDSPYEFEFIALGEGYQFINIPLEATQSLASASTARAVLGNILLAHVTPIGLNSGAKQNMAAARYKPWYAGVPQQSNRFTWGPWGQASNFGKAEVIFDDSYHPGVFGGVQGMNNAALSKISNSTNAGAHLENENGSVTISGLPEYKMGSPMQLYMVSGFSDINTPAIGPYITDIAIDIGPDGVSTTYRMQTQRSFGDLSSIYENALQKISQDSIDSKKKSADATKEMRRVDVNSNQRITRTTP